MTSNPLRDLARELEGIRKSIRDQGSTPQLGTSSIENGKILEHDVNGVLKQTIGLQVDGTNTTAQFNGPTPPAPSKPTFELQNGSVRVSWDGQWVGGAVAPMDLARIDVHFIDELSDDPMEMPSRGSILAQGWGDIALPLIPGSYHAVLVARTTSGSYNASEPSDEFTVTALVAGSITETEIADDSISTPKLQANSVVTDKLATNAVTANEIAAGAVKAEHLESVLAIIGKLQAGGNVEISPPSNVDGVLEGGIVIYDPITADVLVRLHPDGCTFRGKVEADILTVLQDLVINGDAELSSGGTMTLRNGVSDPLDGPDWASSPYLYMNWPAPLPGCERRGICWDAVGGQWIELFTHLATKATRYRAVQTDGSVTGGYTSFLASIAGLGLGSVSFIKVSSVTVLGTAIYVAAIYEDGSGYQYTVIHRSTLSTGARLAEITIAGVLGSPAEPGVGNDGTNIYTVNYVESTNTLTAGKLTAALGIVGSTTLTGAALGGAGNAVRFVGVGDFGYGSSKLTVAHEDHVDVYPLPAFSGDTKARDAALSFDLDQSLATGGLAFKTSGSNQFFYSTHNDGKLWLWGTYYPSAGEKFWGKYIDQDTGGAHHTAPSGVSSIAVGKRRFAFATLRPAPAGVDESLLFVGYGSTLPATFYERSEALTFRTMFLIGGKDTTGSTTVPSTNTFGPAPSELKSELGEGMFLGDGYGQWPGLVTPHVRYASSGTIVTTTGVARALNPLVIADAATQISGSDDFTESSGAITVGYGGMYEGLLSFSFEADPTMTGARIAQLLVNGAAAGTWNDACMTAGTYSHQVHFKRRLNAGDVITTSFSQNSGGPLNISGTISLNLESA